MQDFTEEEKAVLVKSATELFKISKSLYNIDIDASYKILDISDQLLSKFESINKMVKTPLFEQKDSPDCGCSQEQKNNIAETAVNCNGHCDTGCDINNQVIDDDTEIKDLVSKIRAKVGN